MKVHIYNEQNRLYYTRYGDVYLPDLTYSKNKYSPLGKYGMLRKTYLKENYKAQYSLMLLNDTLWPHLLEIDERAHAMVETMVAQMAKAEGVTESLKSTDPLRWGAGLRRRPLPKAEAPTELRVSGGHLAKRSNDRGCGSPVATFAAGKSNDRGGSRDPAAENGSRDRIDEQLQKRRGGNHPARGCVRVKPDKPTIKQKQQQPRFKRSRLFFAICAIALPEEMS